MVVTASISSMTDTEIAWLAGMYEGEGWVEVTLPTHPRARTSIRRARLRIGSSDLDITQRLAALSSSSTITTRRATDPKHKTMHYWSVADMDEVSRLLTLMRPWMGNRRGKRADEVLTLISARREPGATRNTHCVQSHALTPDNLIRRVEKAREYHRCRTCAKSQWTAQNEKRKLTGQVISA